MSTLRQTLYCIELWGIMLGWVFGMFRLAEWARDAVDGIAIFLIGAVGLAALFVLRVVWLIERCNSSFKDDEYEAYFQTEVVSGRDRDGSLACDGDGCDYGKSAASGER